MLRHADTSVILDLIRLPFPDRKRYVERVLGMLAALRRRIGLPHRIVVDEAHYFLHDAQSGAALLDLELGGYTLVTYRATGLSPEVLAATSCVIVTRETDHREVGLLREAWKGRGSLEEWSRTLGSQHLEEAVLLPNAIEAGGQFRHLRLAPRLTHHVRHRHKYLDLGVDDALAFRFSDGDGPRVRSLTELVEVLHGPAPAGLGDHLRRGDLSAWLEHAFGDRILADRVREIEGHHRIGAIPDPVGAIVHAVEDRYGEPSGPRAPREAEGARK